MAIASPEHPAFDPNAEYGRTLAAFGQAFENASLNLRVFDTGLGARVIAGTMDACPELSMVEGATSIHLVVVEHERDNSPRWYRYGVQHLDAYGLPLGELQSGTYWSNYGRQQAQGLLPDEAARMRGWLDAARYDFDEAALEVSSNVCYGSGPDFLGTGDQSTGNQIEPAKPGDAGRSAQAEQPEEPEIPALPAEQEPADIMGEEARPAARRGAAARFAGWLASRRANRRSSFGDPGTVS